MNTNYELVVIGGGPAGLAAAYSAYEQGLERILIVERDKELGGILNQCIHNGFGLHHFKEELTGPEYAAKFVDMLKSSTVDVLLNTMVLEFNKDKEVHIVSPEVGYQIIQAGAIVLGMGCRERTRGAIAIPGTRPAGIFTAGTAQRYVNMEGHMVGRRVVILGSGDIGLIMARRMTLEGAKVLACVELMPYSGGLTRNIVQCLDDFDIPLYLSHTITNIEGRNRVEGVTIAKVDNKLRPIAGSETQLDCDTVLFSVGLIPENELSKQAGVLMDNRTSGAVVYENMETSIPGIFACGNVVHVHDLVDFVTEESVRAGASAAKFVQSKSRPADSELVILGGAGVSYTVPQKAFVSRLPQHLHILFRVNKTFGKSKIIVKSGGQQIAKFSREHAAPGEMEKITIPLVLLNKAKDSIEISVKEEN